MREITNTQKISPLDHLVDHALLGTSDAIEISERQGGAEMVAATRTVPTDGAELLEQFGFQLGEIVADDPIFREVTAPAGWRREPGENPYGYWSYLVDPAGNRRVAIFYKAAFYDRSAHLHLVDE